MVMSLFSFMVMVPVMMTVMVMIMLQVTLIMQVRWDRTGLLLLMLLRMFKLIIKNPYNHILNPTIIMSDFENGLISAAKECFPNARHVVRYIEILLCV